jgi:L-threonylcarbamoyladenylate synthase
MNSCVATDDGVVEGCLSALEAGQLAVVPTDRWYMIVGNASDPSAAAAIFGIKRRSPDKSLLLVCPSLDWIESNFAVTSGARELARAFWPGDLAMRLRWAAPAEQQVAAVGVPVALVTLTKGLLGRLASQFGALVSTSVNYAGTPDEGGTQPAFAFQQVVGMLSAHADSERVGMVVDGGVCPQVDAMTIVDCSDSSSSFLERPGAVHRDALEFALPELDLSRARRDMAGYDQRSYRP